VIKLAFIGLTVNKQVVHIVTTGLQRVNVVMNLGFQKNGDYIDRLKNQWLVARLTRLTTMQERLPPSNLFK
jgi:hypothetical protein